MVSNIDFILLTCIVICTIVITGVSFMGTGFFLYKALIFYKANGTSKEEIHCHNYDHFTKDDDDDPLDSWKNGNH